MLCVLSEKSGHTLVQWMVAILDPTSSISMGLRYGYLPASPSDQLTLKKGFVSANIALFVYGFENNWISPMTKVLQSESSPAGEPLSDYAISWIASVMCFAAVFGTSAYAYIADKYGRKVAVMALLYPQTISWALKLYPTMITLTLSRICGGLAAGGCFNVVPMYVKEISQDSIRGILGSLLFLSQSLGGLIIYVIGAYLDYYTVQWSIIGIPIVAAMLMLKAPETPAYLVKKGKIDEALTTLAILRGLNKHDKRVQEEVDRMRKEEDNFQSLPNVALISLFIDKTWRRSVIIILIAGTILGCNGAYATVVFASSLLTYASSDFRIGPEVQSFSFPIVMIISSLVLAGIIERFGRKRLLVAAYTVSALSFATLATSLLVREAGGNVPGWLPLAAMIVNVFMFAGGVCSLTYIILTEMFNFQIRAKVMGLVVTYIWFIESIQILITTPICKSFGYPSLFYLFTAINLVGAIFTLIFIPETKGRSEEDVQRIIRGQGAK